MNNMNDVKLTDDELCVVMAALQVVLVETKKEIQKHGVNNLDLETRLAIKDTAALFTKLQAEFF